ncbi:MAG: 30S ribosomal protein S21 [Candidatus Chisholmbacteria bacterium]|nr:30S ribosomal protein S21 [Candidatus Chisholmbacteria bacterium]
MATVVKAKTDEPVDSVIRRFKKQVIMDEVLPEIQKRKFYKKPSEERKERRKEWERLQRRLHRGNFG